VSAELDIVVLDGAITEAALDQLASVLADCVEGGASVSFMSPFSHAEALAFFRKVAGSVASAPFSSDWICPPISRIVPMSRNCWCIGPRAASESAPP
jgi:hypothetical protein